MTSASRSARLRVRLQDRELDDQLRRDGFVRVPFLDSSALEVLRVLWDEVAPSSVSGIYSNVHAGDSAVNHRVDQVITACFEEPARELFADGRLSGASFLVKGTGAGSASTLHQDWNNVEEDQAESLSIWCPLVDVDVTNGALQVIPGSHRSRPSIRSLDTPSLYLDFTPELDTLLQVLPAAAGEAVLYVHNLFHGSKPNHSGQIRVAAVSGVLPRGVRNVHYRRTPSAAEGTFDVLAVQRRFFFDDIPAMAGGAVPASAKIVDQVQIDNHHLNHEDVQRATKAPRREEANFDSPRR